MSNQRRNNPSEMSVVEQLTTAAEQMCTKYCKHPGQYHEMVLYEEFNDDDEAREVMLEAVCKYCPMKKILG